MHYFNIEKLNNPVITNQKVEEIELKWFMWNELFSSALCWALGTRLHSEEMNDNLITLKRLLYAWIVKDWDVLECSRPPKHHKWKEIEYAKPKQSPCRWMSMSISLYIGSNPLRTYHSNNKQILTQEPWAMITLSHNRWKNVRFNEF